MSKICRLGEGRALALAKRRKLRKEMRMLIDANVQDSQVRDAMHSAFNKVCESYCIDK